MTAVPAERPWWAEWAAKGPYVYETSPGEITSAWALFTTEHSHVVAEGIQR